MTTTTTLAARADPPRALQLDAPPLLTFLLGRLVRGVGVLVVLSVLAFAMVRSLPGDPVANLAGPYSTEAQRQQLVADLGLDGSLVTQYFSWIGRVLVGDWGTSVFSGLPTTQLIADRLPNTIELAVAAALVSVAWGVPAGALSAQYRGRAFDTVVRTLTFLGMATPVFAFGVVLVLLFTTYLPAWPTLSFVPFATSPGQNLASVVLPALALGLPMGSTICRFTRSSMLEVYEQDYIRTALAGGATPLQATLRHGLRNAAAPVTTIAGLQLAGLVGHAILIENVFAIPGIGQLTVTSITQRDYAVAQAAILLLGTVYVVMNLIIDALYPVLDPRIGGRR